jgi:hypothetical protein
MVGGSDHLVKAVEMFAGMVDLLDSAPEDADQLR